MMSQTHILIASSLFTKPGQTARNCAVLLGAFVPDMAIYGLFLWSKMAGIPEATVWNELYWQEPWQTYTAAGNSIPIYGLILLLGVFALRQVRSAHKIGLVLTFFALAALVHIAGDLPVHVKDAHRHFWPISDWKFISPVSYWDPDHHGRLFMLFEMLLGILMVAVLFRRFKNWFVRIPLVIILTAYVAVPLYFILQLGGA